MKTKHIVTGLAILALLISSAKVSHAQAEKKGFNNPEGRMHGVCNLPDMTEDQKNKIHALKIAHTKEITPLKNELAEKRARKRSLSTVDKPDMAAINKVIDEMSAIRGEMMKKKAAHFQEIRKVLNDEQRVVFDAHAHKMEQGKHKGGKHIHKGEGQQHRHGHGHRHGQGNCPHHN